MFIHGLNHFCFRFLCQQAQTVYKPFVQGLNGWSKTTVKSRLTSQNLSKPGKENDFGESFDSLPYTPTR
jgi:hypothetical protein